MEKIAGIVQRVCKKEEIQRDRGFCHEESWLITIEEPSQTRHEVEGVRISWKGNP